MITRNNSKITVDNKERLINIKELSDLSRKYLPDDMSAEYKDKFVDEVIFRISDLEFDRIDTNGKTIEEYYLQLVWHMQKKMDFRNSLMKKTI